MSNSSQIQPSRRAVLGGILGGMGVFGTTSFLHRLAQASELSTAPEQYFIFCYFSGGWDLLLGLDPKDPGVFLDEVRSETLIQPGYDLLQDASITPDVINSAVPGMDFGPYIGDLLGWAPQMAVVRGMSMDTLTHEVGRRRFITGKPPAGLQARGSSGATVLAACLGFDDPMPHLASQVETYNVDQAPYASALQVNNVNDLRSVLSPGEAALPPEVAARIAALLDGHANCKTTRASPVLSAALAQRLAAHELVDQGLDALFDFGSSDADMVALRAHYGFSAGNLGSAGAQAAMAATAIASGITRVASIRVASGLDTHDNWAQEQGPAQRAGFDVVAALADDLASRPFKDTGDSWLDHTTIVGFSEFSRTPLINARAGRDHSLMNGCFLLGGLTRGGTVIGASSDVGMSPQAVSLATGQLAAGGEIIKPEHVWRTLLHGVGVEDDVADLRVDPLMALLA